MRKFALLFSPCAVLVFASLFTSLFATSASAQQTDILVGGGILLSTSKTSDVVGFQPLIEKGGIYPAWGLTSSPSSIASA